VANESLRGDYSKLRPGDCVVAFAREDIFSIKHQIEQLTSYRCAVIYGQLPPETRSAQARMFNEGQVEILVASDAIGMGLNLNIGRTIFHTVLKHGGKTGPYWIDPSAVKQV
jgi:ATP-dependent RNA helicase SUPV3L1/SUV3